MSAVVVCHWFGSRRAARAGIDSDWRDDRGVRCRNLPDTGNVLRRRKAHRPKEVCARAAIATSRISSTGANSGTPVGFGCFRVACGYRQEDIK